MFINTKIIFSLFYLNSFIFLLSVITAEVNADTKIIAKSGDTLLKISKKYGVPLKILMYKNNLNDAEKIIEGEVIVIPLKNVDDNSNENVVYKVKEGDTLYKIAKAYNVNIKNIIALNNLSNHSYLKINQIILLPKRDSKKIDIRNVDIKQASKKVIYHLTSKVEDLSAIAKIHKITKEEINNLNKLNDPIKINPNTKLQLRNKKIPKWRKYGSIIINWSDWTYFDGNYISEAKTKKNKSFYIAINCKKRTLNNTLNLTYWTEWYYPTTDYEFQFINDFCDQEFKF